ncbi:Transcription factor BTF3 4 [Sparganum proliferum]
MIKPDEVRYKFNGNLHVVMATVPEADKLSVFDDFNVLIGADHIVWGRKPTLPLKDLKTPDENASEEDRRFRPQNIIHFTNLNVVNAKTGFTTMKRHQQPVCQEEHASQNLNRPWNRCEQNGLLQLSSPAQQQLQKMQNVWVNCTDMEVCAYEDRDKTALSELFPNVLNQLETAKMRLSKMNEAAGADAKENDAAQNDDDDDVPDLVGDFDEKSRLE